MCATIRSYGMIVRVATDFPHAPATPVVARPLWRLPKSRVVVRKNGKIIREIIR